MPGERRGGPVAMSADELASFIDEEPTGAICLTDADGLLFALPADVLGQVGELLTVEVGGLDELPVPGSAACVVADRFTSYEAIRGFIAQGSISAADHVEAERSNVAVGVARMVTFSFANVKL